MKNDKIEAAKTESGENMIKLIAIDMDGTCLDSKSRMSEETVEALRKAAEKGIIIVPATGRNLSCLPHRLQRENFYRYVITSNGAGVIDLKENKRIYNSCIKYETAVDLLKKCRGKGFGVAAHINEEYYIQGKLLSLAGRIYFGRDAQNAISEKDICKMTEEKQSEVEEIQLYLIHPKSRERIKEILKSYSDFSVAYSSIYVEIFDKNASKGRALSELAQKLGIEKGEIACVGDGENDLSMFEASGLKFAMGNAVDELKEKADIILPSNNENGVAEAVNRILLSDCCA